jgi:hypothetical protein
LVSKLPKIGRHHVLSKEPSAPEGSWLERVRRRGSIGMAVHSLLCAHTDGRGWGWRLNFLSQKDRKTTVFRWNCVSLLPLFFAVLGMELRALHMPGKYFVTKSPSQPSLFPLTVGGGSGTCVVPFTLTPNVAHNLTRVVT